MTNRRKFRKRFCCVLSTLVATIYGSLAAWGQPPGPDASKAYAEIYGHAMVDTGYDFKQNNPDWFDVMRPTKLPSFENEFGKDGRFYSGVRQSRLGFRGYIPTSLGQLKTIFEFELFGTGVDAGQTTFRIRHAWGEIGHFGGGQTWSPFMDPDVFPNSLEYWGPNGMVFFATSKYGIPPGREKDRTWSSPPSVPAQARTKASMPAASNSKA